jgi:hypothetical protein
VGGPRAPHLTLRATEESEGAAARFCNESPRCNKNERTYGGDIHDGAVGPSRRCVGLGEIIRMKTAKFTGAFFPTLKFEQMDC